MTTCPFCGAEPINPQYPHILNCGTCCDRQGKFDRGEECFNREPLFQELQSAKSLIEALEKAGDALDKVADDYAVLLKAFQHFEMWDEVVEKRAVWKTAKNSK